ncbi:AraC family L-rhamnose operon regulatory protein RhaS [Paenibacillus sacheonensis]|nr:AraC family L-rhamnose operon regulatory protein RhaS [Paenibacillus sacheonensis]
MKFQASLYLKDPKSLPVYVERKVHRIEDLPPVHEHAFYELVYIVHGHASHYFENKYYPLHGGDVLLVRPGQFHTYVLEQGESFELVNCLFMPELFEREWLKAVDPKGQIESFLMHPFLKREDEFHPRISLELRDARRVERLLEEMLDEQKEAREGHATIQRLKLFELLHLLLRCQNEAMGRAKQTSSTKRSDSRDLIVRRIHQFLIENPEQKQGMELLAGQFGVSVRHLNRLFKQDTGKTMLEMLHYVRIERAKELLMHTSDRVVDIAARIGYEDASFFTRLFMRKVRCSPAKYREEMQHRSEHR